MESSPLVKAMKELSLSFRTAEVRVTLYNAKKLGERIPVMYEALPEEKRESWALEMRDALDAAIGKLPNIEPTVAEVDLGQLDDDNVELTCKPGDACWPA